MRNFTFMVEMKREDKDLPHVYTSNDGRYEIDMDNLGVTWLTTLKGKYPFKGGRMNGLNQVFYRNLINGIQTQLVKYLDEGRAELYWHMELSDVKRPKSCEDCHRMNIVCGYDEERGWCPVYS